MLEQRLNQRFVLMMTLIVLAAFFALFVIWTIVSQLSLTSTVGISTTIQTAPIVKAVDAVETANYLKLNQQSVGLASNWNAYQASLNYADYSTSPLLWNPATEYVLNTPLVSHTSSLDYNLPAESEYFKGVPMKSLTTRYYTFPFNNSYQLDTPLVNYTAGVNR